MENYKIKAKKVIEPTYSSIVVWLEIGTDSDFDPFSLVHRDLALTWLSYHEGLKRKMLKYNNDINSLVSELMEQFYVQYSDVIQNLEKATDLENVEIMIEMIRLFITASVIENEPGNQQMSYSRFSD